MEIINRIVSTDTSRAVALETTLPALGLPQGEGLPFSRELDELIEREGARPAPIGMLGGRAIVGMSGSELETLLDGRKVEKANTANLGVLAHREADAATTVSVTMELAARAGVRLFATGGLGGVHRGYGQHLDISSDLAAFTRFPVAVVTSGTKSLLDVESTREALETLGIPVVGFRCDAFPSFYMRGSGAGLDARFDEEAELAAFLSSELERTDRGIVVCNPIPSTDEIAASDWARWLGLAQDETRHVKGRDVTPAMLGALHRVSNGATLRANLALVRSNARLAARLASTMR